MDPINYGIEANVLLSSFFFHPCHDRGEVRVNAKEWIDSALDPEKKIHVQKSFSLHICGLTTLTPTKRRFLFLFLEL